MTMPVDIQPEFMYQLQEFFIEESELIPDKRFEVVNVNLKIGDLISLFSYSVDESLNYEMPSLILENKPMSDKLMAERARADDRLERMCMLLEAVGIKKDAFLKYLYLKKNEMLDDVNEINECLIQSEIDSKTI